MVEANISCFRTDELNLAAQLSVREDRLDIERISTV